MPNRAFILLIPLWLSPEQVAVCTITSEVDEYAKTVVAALTEAGISAKLDIRNEKINFKVREHSHGKIPVILALGKREAEENTVSMRRLGFKHQKSFTLEEAITTLKAEIDTRRAEADFYSLQSGFWATILWLTLGSSVMGDLHEYGGAGCPSEFTDRPVRAEILLPMFGARPPRLVVLKSVFGTRQRFRSMAYRKYQQKLVTTRNETRSRYLRPNPRNRLDALCWRVDAGTDRHTPWIK